MRLVVGLEDDGNGGVPLGQDDTTRPRQGAVFPAVQELVHVSRGLPTLGDGPHHQRLTSPTICNTTNVTTMEY